MMEEKISKKISKNFQKKKCDFFILVQYNGMLLLFSILIFIFTVSNFLSGDFG